MNHALVAFFILESPISDFNQRPQSKLKTTKENIFLLYKWSLPLHECKFYFEYYFYFFYIHLLRNYLHKLYKTCHECSTSNVDFSRLLKSMRIVIWNVETCRMCFLVLEPVTWAPPTISEPSSCREMQMGLGVRKLRSVSSLTVCDCLLVMYEPFLLAHERWHWGLLNPCDAAMWAAYHCAWPNKTCNERVKSRCEHTQNPTIDFGN